MRERRNVAIRAVHLLVYWLPGKKNEVSYYSIMIEERQTLRRQLQNIEVVAMIYLSNCF